MGYITAYMRRQVGTYSDVTIQGGFYTHQVGYVEAGPKEGTTLITLKPLHKMQSLSVTLRLPPEKVHALLGELDAAGGSLDLLQHSNPKTLFDTEATPPDPEIETYAPRNPRQVQKIKPGGM